MDVCSGHVCIVEDNTSVREALTRLLHASGLEVHAFASAEDFQNNRPPTPCACLLLDIRLPGISGIGLHDLIRRRSSNVPVVFLTGHGDVPMAVEAMKNGAVDFLTKPVDEEILIQAVRKAMAVHSSAATRDRDRQIARERLEKLTPRERDVLREVITGAQNKQVADRLGIALKTVKIHRSRVMVKMEAASVVDLLNLASQAGFPSE